MKVIVVPATVAVPLAPAGGVVIETTLGALPAEYPASVETFTLPAVPAPGAAPWVEIEIGPFGATGEVSAATVTVIVPWSVVAPLVHL